eukprot:365652-Chlamydomonas_euryale.AAC.9
MRGRSGSGCRLTREKAVGCCCQHASRKVQGSGIEEERRGLRVREGKRLPRSSHKQRGEGRRGVGGLASLLPGWMASPGPGRGVWQPDPQQGPHLQRPAHDNGRRTRE